jgi:hypothetical protein
MLIQPKLKDLVSRRELLITGLVFILCLWVFRHVPIQQVGGDDRYSMLLSENLLRHRDFTLERYDLPRPDYRLEDIDEHRYYGFPPGTSVLSVPYVALMHLHGESVIRGDGSYDFNQEARLDARLAALLMAAFAAIVYLTARLLLPVRWSLVVTFASAFGTQVFSTMSRAMWSDTWGVFLVGLAVFMMLKAAVRKTPLSLPLLATIEAWAYMVRPTNSLVLLGTTIYLALMLRAIPWRFLVVAGAWLALFVAYSWRHFHQFLPSYFAAGRIGFSVGPWALLGNLLSPGRGLLVYVPLVASVGVLLLRYRQMSPCRGLLVLSASLICGHMIMLSGFEHWWGGHCFGARLTASLVPWIVVLEIIAVDAFRESSARRALNVADAVWLAIAGVLSISSVAINSVGAFSREASTWNVNPDIDFRPERLWNWRRPQFLAPFIEPDGPFPTLPPGGLPLAAGDSANYLGLGWSGAEGSFRWTDGTHATMRFSMSGLGPGVVEIDARPYLGGGKLSGQRLTVSMNGRPLQSLMVREPEFAVYEVAVPANVVQSENRLRLELPDATSPAAMEKASDRRDLGLAVRTIAWRSAAAPR